MSKFVNLCRYIFSFHTSMRIYQLHIYVTVLFSAFIFLFIVFLLLWLEIFCQADLVRAACPINSIYSSLRLGIYIRMLAALALSSVLYRKVNVSL